MLSRVSHHPSNQLLITGTLMVLLSRWLAGDVEEGRKSKRRVAPGMEYRGSDKNYNMRRIKGRILGRRKSEREPT